jgi:hypothetical protein
MRKSFLQRVQPSRQRWKMVDWPFPVADDEARPQLKVRVLGQNEAEAAHLATVDYFAKAKKAVRFTDPAFNMRERAELVWRAYADADGDPIAADVNELVGQPLALIDELHTAWVQFQNDVCAVPHTAKEMDALVDLLKKNMDADRLSALPSSWLIGLVRTLASQLPTSTQASELG